jgi:hypothetical protein
MKKSIFCLMFLILISCEKVENDANLTCAKDCTHIEGRIVTKDNLPVKDIGIVFRFQKNTGTYSLYSRIIAQTKTDVQGNYSMDFFLKDEELGFSSGSFDLFIKQNSISESLFYPSNIYLFNSIYQIENRNVSLVHNVYLPTKKKIKIKLQGFLPPANDDWFEIRLYVPCGFDSPEVNTFYENFHRYETESINKYRLTSESQIFEINAALNETNYVVLVRRKNGIYTEEKIPILIDENSNSIFTYTY